MEHASSVDVGARKRGSGGINEDSVATTVLENHHRETGRSVGVFVLADGVGGEASGDVASFLVTSIVRKRLTERLQGSATDVLERFGIDAYPADPPTVDEDPRAVLSEGRIRSAIKDGVDAAHRKIQEYASAIGGQPATTVVVAVYADGKLHYGWVGDSRLYVVNTKRGTIRQLTEDHAVTNVRLKRGEIEDEAYARVHEDATAITNAVGGSSAGKPSVDVEFGTTDVFREDVIMLTSDGLVDAYPDVRPLRREYERAEDTDPVCEKIRDTLVTEDEIMELVLGAEDLHGAVTDLVAFANERGGKDNISITLARDPNARPTPESMVSRAETVIEPADDGSEGYDGSDDSDGNDSTQADASSDGPEPGGSAGDDSPDPPASASTGQETNATGATDAEPDGTGSTGESDDPESAADPDASGSQAHDVDVVSLGSGSPSAALAVPSEGTVYEIAADTTVGRGGESDQDPDLALDVATDAHVEPVHARITFDESGQEWQITDRSSSGTHVEVGDGEWLLLLSEEGLERHRESGFDPDAATERSIEQSTALEEGAAFVVEDPREDDAITCRFFTSVELARERLADGSVREAGFERFVL
ncbi:Serine/threonine protein phosphatase PrpC [Halomicrobium zhouii]|uniref:Serine/threonine protein phosphatase PrpC n=1 Tax=Halomicrobium zhouii TaxID=767519 RepID=A0A1I6KMJ2_9EURY|nr:protein phosphatase 2C domain-containing protein [Halomicrobium zhouii]SFR92374.1 Serine/threonine protein phosphatase PrpC [Halomicrobium zhouii]